MIYGAPMWNNPATYYSQINNSIESLLHVVLPDNWLESCGPTAMASCIDALGCMQSLTLGSYHPQIEDLITLYMNDPQNASILTKIRNVPGVPGNRVPQYYPTAAKALFGVNAKFVWTEDSVDVVIDALMQQQTAQLCFKSPGHFVAVVAYDSDSHELIYNDSNARQFKVKGGGFNVRIPIKSFTRFQGYAIIYLGRAPKE